MCIHIYVYVYIYIQMCHASIYLYIDRESLEVNGCRGDALELQAA